MIDHSQAVEAAKDVINYVAKEDVPAYEFWRAHAIYLARYIISAPPPAPTGEAFDARGFVERCYNAGFSDGSCHSRGANYDCVAAVDAFTAELQKHIAAQGRAGEGWQDIETAPKDGTHILIGWHGAEMRFISRWLKSAGEWLLPVTTAPVPLKQPTCWHALPTTPPNTHAKE